MTADFVIVGSGLTGAVIARELADAGKSVVVLERRKHFGGNVFDHTHASGIRVHTYGPHYFRTNSDELWRFVNRFGSFYRYEALVKTLVDGAFENWPVAGSYIRRVVGENWAPSFTGTPRNFEEAALAIMPRPVYEKFVRGYTEKQWGVSARSLAVGLAQRLSVRDGEDPRFTQHRHQGLPIGGYAGLMQKILAGIPLVPDCDYLKHQTEFVAGQGVVFTGPIDEYFGFDLGRLSYRSQRREHEFRPQTGFALPCAQVNNPDPANGAHIRTVEWKRLMQPEELARISGTVLTRETTVTPDDPNDYEYPFPDEANARLFAAYKERVRRIPRLLVCGRLGEYHYYDMDQAIARARLLAKRVLAGIGQSMGTET